MSKLVLQATDLKVSYGNQPPVFSELTFSLFEGKYMGLSGPSGSGKTTLLRLCAGLFGLDHNPNVSGKLVYAAALDLIGSTPKQRLPFRSDVVSMITENPRAGLHPQRTIAHSWRHYGISTALYAALGELGIQDLERISSAYPHELSGGEAQRVRLAFALSKKPKLLLLESPTAALDKVNAQLVWQQVQRAKENGTAILHVDHNLKLLDAYADTRIQLGAALTLDQTTNNQEVTLGNVVLAAADVNVSYGDFPAVNAIRLELKQGEFVALLGPSGAGKSSFGKALAGIQPAVGELVIEGQSSAFAKTPYDRVDTRIQYIWQEPRLSMNPKFTVAKTLLEAIGTRSIDPAYLLELVDLGVEKLKQSALTLSTGEQQRLAIARALAVEPKVLVCDEITSGLDTHRSLHVLSTLHRLRKELGIAVLFITHDEYLAARHANRAVEMRAGELVA